MMNPANNVSEKCYHWHAGYKQATQTSEFAALSEEDKEAIRIPLKGTAPGDCDV